MSKAPTHLYMVIDTTVLTETRIVAVAPLLQATAIGRIIKATPGKQVICPPIEGRGFSKLSAQQLQYLFWNAKQETPAPDVETLIKNCLEFAKTFPLDPTPLEVLEGQVARLYPEGSTTPSSAATAGEAKPPKAPREPGEPHDRPKGTTTTGLVWDIADQQLAIVCPGVVHPFPAEFDWKVVREALMVACENEGINKATAATQYSKWKGAKIAGK